MAKVAPAEYTTRPTSLGKAPGLGTARGQLRRGVPLTTAERHLRQAIAADSKALAAAVMAALREAGALDRLAADAAKYLDTREDDRRREEKQRRPTPTGRGGTRLGADAAKDLRQVFSREALGFLAELIEDPIDAFELGLASTLDADYHDLFDLGGRAARLSLGVRGGFDLRSPAIAEALQGRANMLAGNVADDVFDRIITTIAQEFYLDGENPLTVAKTLAQEFDWLSQGRAERIARTESLTVTEEAQWTTYAASGVEWKRWLTTLDGKERPTHFDAHGQLVPIDEPFEVGESLLMYPGDADGPAEEICNCRCAHQAVVVAEQVFNDRAVWNGDNDPDQFSKERIAERRAAEEAGDEPE